MPPNTHLSDDSGEVKGLAITDFEGLKGESLRKQDIYIGQRNLFDEGINHAIEILETFKSPEVQRLFGQIRSVYEQKRSKRKLILLAQ